MKTCYWKLQNTDNDKKAYAEAAEFIQKGEVVAFPTETVYGLGANGLNGEAVNKIFAAKGRPNDNPLILHISELKEIEPLTTGLNANAKALAAAFWPGPLTLIVNKSSIVPDEVSAGLATVAVRMPSNKYAQQFIKACGCPIAAPSANISGRPSPTNAQDVQEDMNGKVAGILDGGDCGIGLESTIVDTTEEVPTILRPGGITFEMLTEVLGVVEIDKALTGDKNFKPKAPGMKYRHYAPKAPMYLLEGAAVSKMVFMVFKALAEGKKVGILCSKAMQRKLFAYFVCALKEELPLTDDISLEDSQAILNNLDKKILGSFWGEAREDLASNLFFLLRDFDRTCPDVIIAEGVAEDGIGLAIMNRMRKAAGYQEILCNEGGCYMKNGSELPSFAKGL